MEKFSACFDGLEDPRDDNARHNLLEILVIAFATILCGGEDCSDMALFGRAKELFLRQFLRLNHGIPVTIRSAAYFACSIRRNSKPASASSWSGSLKPP